MMTTMATLGTLLAVGLAASPPSTTSDTVVRSRAGERSTAAEKAARAFVDFVTDAPSAWLPARSLRLLHGDRLVLENGDSVGESPSTTLAIGLREMVAARVILADGDSIGDAPPIPAKRR